MAPPSNRRPGFSRRAQYGLFIGYVVAVAGIVVGLGLILVARFDPPGFALLRAGVLDLTAPISAAGRSGVRSLGDVFDGIGDYLDAGTQNGVLRAELVATRQQLVQAQIDSAENRRLRRLTRLIERSPERVASTRILGSTASDIRRMATIGAGRSDGVRPGMPVRSSEGVVGRVYEAGQLASRVMLLTDGGSVVPVRRLRDGAPALAAGRGDGMVELRPLSAGANPFQPGDIAVTSGIGGVFPPNVPVALVTERREDVAIARPLADPARLDFVIVERPFAPPPPANQASRAEPTLAQ
ncbi:rod shape-determining protein MreC [Sphingomonas quercus]|uniref:Cell shape-determining protein MreC n=1 Tax=Sphingomonas quercus TaxID=2842451 RepID=A0ABS6BKQ5_9SPHN|nr:rod shape-determining protein MreC [Sphingomonas quercus]MBU3078875.1 rod shape-determining protein MreC [Sphingomonas quercus]